MVGGYGMALSFLVPSFPGQGETIGRSRLETGPGGKGSNQAVGAALLGSDVSLLTSVGDDPYGRAGRELWDRAGVDASAVVTVDAPTMVGAILIEPDGENRIVVAPGALDLLSPAHVQGFRAHIRRADVLLVSLEIPAETAVAALRIGRDEQVTTVLNPAPFITLPDATWDLVDVLTPNKSELAAMTSVGDLDDSIRGLRARYRGSLVITLGSEGAEVDTGESRFRVPAPTVKRVVDSTGAGDAFNAALAVSLASGAGLDTAVARAVKAGAHAVQHLGVIPSLPSAEDLK